MAAEDEIRDFENEAAAKAKAAAAAAPTTTGLGNGDQSYIIGFENDEMLAWRQRGNHYGPGRHGPMEYSNDFMVPKGEDEVSENIQAKFADGLVFDPPMSVFEWRLMAELFSAAQKEGRHVESVWSGSNQDGSLNLRVRITPQSGRLPLITLENAETRKTLTTVTAWKENPDGEKAKDVLVQIGKDVTDGKISLDTIKSTRMSG